MEAIEKFNIKGTTTDGEFYGSVTAYSNGMGKVLKKKRTELNIPKEVRNFIVANKKKAVAIVLAGMILISTAGCTQQSKKSEEVNGSKIITEIKFTYEYVVKYGDSLWKIAARYYEDNGDIANEINRICNDNNIERNDILKPGTKLKIQVPISSLAAFGLEAEAIPYEEWEKMDYFVRECFDYPEDKVHPDNRIYWRDKEYVVTGTVDSPSLLHQAARCTYNIEQCNAEPYFYGEDYIPKQEAERLGYLLEAVEIAERNTGHQYGTDFILEDKYILVPLEQTYTP